MMNYLADTTFLIGRWRGGKSSPEQKFIERNPEATLSIAWVVKAEFIRGAEIAGHDRATVLNLMNAYITHWPNDETIALYVDIYAQLRRTNQLIGPHDLWIAACAIQHKLPLLTRNVAEFRRVKDLKCIDYIS